MSQKILLIDWNSIVKSDKLIRFPVSIDLVRGLFGDHAGVWKNKEFQEKYEDKLNALFKNMSKSGIRFFSPGGSELRRLLTMLWWFYIKKNNPPECSTRYFVDGYKEYEDTYNLDPELFEYLYNEYYEYFQDNYVFEVFAEVQRLVDRKPDDWELGIFSTDLAEDELNIVLDKPKSVKSYGDAFKLRFGVNGIISAYAQDIVHPSEVVAKDVNKFKQNRSNIFLLYRSSVEAKHFNSDIKHILLGEEDLMDRVDFDNPGVLLDVNDDYQTKDESDEEVEPEQIGGHIPDTIWCNLLKINVSHLIWTFGRDADHWYKNKAVSGKNQVDGKNMSNDFWATSDNKIIKNLGKVGFNPGHIIVFIFFMLVAAMIATGVSNYLERIYEVNNGHWLSVAGVMLLSGGFCSFIPVLIYSISEIKTKEIEMAILYGFGGGVLVTVLTGFEHMGSGMTGVFIIFTFLSFTYTLEYNKEIKERLTKCEKHECN